MQYSDNASRVLKHRYYRFNEKTPEELFWRSAKFNATVDENPTQWTGEAFEMLANLEFLPNTPYLMNAGTKITNLSACFVLHVPDSMEGIFDTLKHTALIFKGGGGVGLYFGDIRPRNDKIASIETQGQSGIASGPISFARIFNTTIEEIKQGGVRKGAAIMVLPCWHPDILDFISVKRNLKELQNFNVSVSLTDDFMNAVQSSSLTPIINPHTGIVVDRVEARMIWDKLIENAHATGEPGVIFHDTINRANPIPSEEIQCTNPCLSGDTKIAVADGRGAVAIKTLAKENKTVPVFCISNSGKICVRPMRQPRLTKKNTPVLRVTLDSGDTLVVTPDHKFIASNGDRIEAQNLKPGTSLKVAHKSLEIDQRGGGRQYSVMRHRDFQRREHILIAEHHYNKKLTSGWVVHHKDGNTLNNVPDNLIFKQNREHSREHSSAEANPRYSGVTNDELRQKALELTKQLGHRFSKKEWQKYAKSKALPIQFSKWRNDHFNGLIGLAKWAAVELGLEHINSDPRSTRNLQKLRAEGYDCDIVNSNIVFTKSCEICGNLFSTEYETVGFCSRKCSNIALHRKHGKKIRASLRKTCAKKRTKLREVQATIYLNLKPASNLVLKKDWVKECKKCNVPSTINSRNAFKTFKELKSYATDFNHRVVKVEKAGTADVYNGTVDEFHNYLIGDFKNTTYLGNPRTSFINVTQCGEVPLNSEEACNLGSINVTKFVEEKSFNWNKLASVIHKATRFLDNVITLNGYALPQIKVQTLSTRKIGLGIMGWADALMMMEIPYNSEQAVQLARSFMCEFQSVAHEASAKLAHERGNFPKWDISTWKQQLKPMRNATVTTVAPTGSLSIMADCSASIEPVFNLAIKRNLTVGELGVVINPILKMKLREYGITIPNDITAETIKEIIPDNLKPVFVTSHEVSPEYHIKTLAAFQEFTDNAVSKTINLAHSATIRNVEDAYMLAWKLGCKGTTVYRDGCRENQPMS